MGLSGQAQAGSDKGGVSPHELGVLLGGGLSSSEACPFLWGSCLPCTERETERESERDTWGFSHARLCNSARPSHHLFATAYMTDYDPGSLLMLEMFRRHRPARRCYLDKVFSSSATIPDGSLWLQAPQHLSSSSMPGSISNTYGWAQDKVFVIKGPRHKLFSSDTVATPRLTTFHVWFRCPHLIFLLEARKEKASTSATERNLLKSFSRLVVHTKSPKPGKPYLQQRSFLCGHHFFPQRETLHWSRVVYGFFFPVTVFCKWFSSCSCPTTSTLSPSQWFTLTSPWPVLFSSSQVLSCSSVRLVVYVHAAPLVDNTCFQLPSAEQHMQTRVERPSAPKCLPNKFPKHSFLVM